jgi:hypothetical protein
LDVEFVRRGSANSRRFCSTTHAKGDTATRPEAIRRLIELGLKAAKAGK